MQKIAVVGLGYVGLPLALLSAKKGYDVIGIDLDKEKIAKIKNRTDPIGDERIKDQLTTTNLRVSSNYGSLDGCKFVIVCVPTPVNDGNQPDLEPLKAGVSSVAKHLSPGTLVIIESTINPGVCDEIVIPLIEQVSHLKINRDFYVSHCPERINPGDKKWSVDNIPRVVGSSSAKGLKQVVQFYESIIDAPIKPMASLKEAEAVKVVENSFRDVNIAFVNELAMSFTKLGINVKNVIDGAATKPFSFMPHYPSIGVGGHCIPVDPYYLIEYARGYGFEHEFLSLARSINNHMPEFTANQLLEGLAEAGLAPKDTVVTVLGLAYKPDVSDDRESPSYKLIKILNVMGIETKTYDPYLLHKSSVRNLDSALSGTKAVVLATNHSQFMELVPAELKIKVFVDGKNAYSREEFEKVGIIYRGIGQ